MATSGTGNDGDFTVERNLFRRLVSNMGKDAGLAKLVITLWIMIEQLDFEGLIRKIYTLGDSALDMLFNEAVTCLETVVPDSPQPTDLDDTPLLRQLLNEMISRRFFFYNQDFVRNSLNDLMNRFGSVMFGEDHTNEVNNHPLIRSILGGQQGEGTSAQGALRGSTSGHSGTVVTNDQASSSSLNQSSASFPMHVPVSRDQRSLFITFSNGFPLSREEILQFFHTNWGPVVEEVTVECTAPDTPPQFGRIVFHNASIIPVILNNQGRARFLVNGKDLWARLYTPKKKPTKK